MKNRNKVVNTCGEISGRKHSIDIEFITLKGIDTHIQKDTEITFEIKQSKFERKAGIFRILVHG